MCTKRFAGQWNKTFTIHSQMSDKVAKGQQVCSVPLEEYSMTKPEQVEDRPPLSERSSTEGESARNACERLLSESAESPPGATAGDRNRRSSEQEPFPTKRMTELGFPQVELEPHPLPSAEASSTNGARGHDLATPSSQVGRQDSASADGPAPPQQGPIAPRETGELIAPPRAPGSGGDQPRDNSPSQGPTAPEPPQSTAPGPRTG